MQRVHLPMLATAVITLCAALAPVGGAATAAVPTDGEAPATIVLKASDADLHTEKGARALALRIRVAAATVCGADVDPVVRTGDGFHRCAAAAIDAAVQSIHSPLVAEALGRGEPQLAGADR